MQKLTLALAFTAAPVATRAHKNSTCRPPSTRRLLDGVEARRRRLERTRRLLDGVRRAGVVSSESWLARPRAPAQVVTSMGTYSDCDLTAEIEELNIGTATVFVGSGVFGTGMACVEALAGGGIVFSGEIKNLRISSSTAKGGFNIHAGNSCDNAHTQGNHYYAGEPFPEGTHADENCKISEDPWVPTSPYFSFWTTEGTSTTLISNQQHLAEGDTLDGEFNTSTERSQCGVDGHAVIVHKGGDGADMHDRAGCCVLKPVDGR